MKKQDTSLEIALLGFIVVAVIFAVTLVIDVGSEIYKQRDDTRVTHEKLDKIDQKLDEIVTGGEF